MKTLAALLLSLTAAFAAEPVPVVTTFEITADWIRQVGGDRVAVTALAAEGQDPHTFRPTPRHGALIEDAKLVVLVGAGFDTTVKKLAHDHKAVLELAEAIEDEHGHGGEHPFEWAGAFTLEPGMYRWSFAKVDGDYADPAMKMLFVASSGDEPIEAIEEQATELFEGDAKTVAPGGKLVAGMTASVQFDGAKDMTVFDIEVAEKGTYVFFTEHMPYEFEADEHFFKNAKGEDVEPIAEEPEGGHGHHGHGHDDHEGHDDHGHEEKHEGHDHDDHGHEEKHDDHEGHDHDDHGHEEKHDDHEGHDHDDHGHKEKDGHHDHGHKDHDDHGHDDHEEEKAHDDHEGHGHHHHHHHGDEDPHIWLDPMKAMAAVHEIEEALAAIDPANAAEYETRAEAYIAELKELDTWIKTTVATVPAERRVLVTGHDAYRHFADRYGFEVGATILGVSTEAADPSPKQLEKIINKVKEAGVPAVFGEVGANNRLMQTLAREVGVKLGKDLQPGFLGAKDSPTGSYIGLMKTNVQVIVDGLTP